MTRPSHVPEARMVTFPFSEHCCIFFLLWYNGHRSWLAAQMSEMMNFTEIDDALHCTFPDRLDGLACSSVERELLCRITEFKNSRTNVRLVFDLADVVFISSAFLRICLIHFKAVGHDYFSVTNVSEEIHKVFHISGFVELMNVVRADRTPVLA